MADLIETVPASQATSMAKPLARQEFDKGRVWVLLVGGALGLFLVTLLVENNESWFPAISRANKVMKEGSKPQQTPAEEEWQEPAGERNVPLVLSSSRQPANPATEATDDELYTVIEAKRLLAEQQQRDLELFKGGMSLASEEVLGTRTTSATPATPAAAADEGGGSSRSSNSSNDGGSSGSSDRDASSAEAVSSSSSSSSSGVAVRSQAIGQRSVVHSSRQAGR